MYGRELANHHGAIGRVAVPPLLLTAAAGLTVWAAASALFASALPALVTCGVFALIAGIALPSHALQRPRPRFGPANSITLVRAALIAFVCGFAADPPPSAAALWWVAAVTGGVALALDGVDGWVARRTRGQSRFGARFDMETDALAALILCVVVWQAEKAGGWIVILGSLRYVFLAAGWTFAWMRRPLPPSQRRRAICVIQGILLVLCLIPALPLAMSQVLAGAALLLAIGSFSVDTAWLARRRGHPL